MFFSVIIPIRNAEKFLKAAIDSVLNQKFSDYEIIIVDNASTDSGSSIIKAYQEKYPNIRYICHEQDRGLLQSRITGAKEARGEYLLNLDADDYFIGTDAFSILKKAVKKSQADIIQYDVCSDIDWGIWFNPLKPALSSDAVREQYFQYPMGCSSMWSRAVKRSLYLDILAYIPANLYLVQSEDVLQGALLMNRAASYAAVDQKIYHYRMQGQGASQGSVISKNIDNLCALEKVFSILDKEIAPNFLEPLKRILLEHNLQSLIRSMDGKALSHLYEEWTDKFLKVFPLDIIGKYSTNYLPIEILPFLLNSPKKVSSQKNRSLAIYTSGKYVTGGMIVQQLFTREFKKRGYDIHLFVLEPWPEELPLDEEIPITVLGMDIEDRYSLWKELLSKYPVDIFIFHDCDNKITFYDFFFLKLLGKKILINIHSSYNYQKIIIDDSTLFKLRDAFYKYADVVAVLQKFEAILYRNLGLPTVIVNNPLHFSLEEITLAPLDNHNILWIARLTTGKQCLLAVQAFHKALSACPEDTHLYILGSADKDEKDLVDLYIAEQNLTEKISILGHVNIKSYLEKASLNLVTSKSESFSMVIAETKAYGIPTIMFELPKIMMHNTGGLITVPQGDVDAMAEEIIKVLTNAPLRKQLGKEAKASLEPFRTEKTMQRWDQLIQAVALNQFSDSHPLAKVEADAATVKLLCQDIELYMCMPSGFDIIQKILPPGSLRRRIAKKLFSMAKGMYKIVKKISRRGE